MTLAQDHQSDGHRRALTVPDHDIDPLLKLLGVDLARLHPQEAAAIQALAAEVLALRRDRSDLLKQIEEAAALADRDTLCPVFNRRAFERELGREIALAKRYGVPLCLVFIDLDRFKQVNDVFGHATGDRVLTEVSEIIRKNVRQTDIVGRLGGDEFGIALTHADHADSQAKTQRLAQLIDGMTVRARGDPLTPITLGASCGTVQWSVPMTPAALIAAADEAMFHNKSARRAAR